MHVLWVWSIFCWCVGFSLVLCVAVRWKSHDCEITEHGIILQVEDIMLVVKVKIVGVTDLFLYKTWVIV
jgi:hypothetical protein